MWLWPVRLANIAKIELFYGVSSTCQFFIKRTKPKYLPTWVFEKKYQQEGNYLGPVIESDFEKLQSYTQL